MRANAHGRNTAAYIRAAKQFCAPRINARCWLCGEAIIYGLRPRHKSGPSLDHLIPLSLGGELMAPSNWRLAHYGCNCDRRNNAPTQYAYATDTALLAQAGCLAALGIVSNQSRAW